MQKKTIEEFEYTPEDIEKLILEDIRKHIANKNINKQRVNIHFNVGSDPRDNDGPGYARQILQGADVTVDVTQ